jgi:hypothetical protein
MVGSAFQAPYVRHPSEWIVFKRQIRSPPSERLLMVVLLGVTVSVLMTMSQLYGFVKSYQHNSD